MNFFLFFPIFNHKENDLLFDGFLNNLFYYLIDNTKKVILCLFANYRLIKIKNTTSHLLTDKHFTFYKIQIELSIFSIISCVYKILNNSLLNLSLTHANI